MPISDQFTSFFSKEWEINFTQCTPNGYLKYTELCNLFQLTAATHSEIGGISFSDMQHYNQAWVLSRMRVEIDKLPRWKDTVTVKTWINSLEDSRSIRAIEMYLNGEKILGAETFWVVFNTQKRRPEPLMLPYSHFELFPKLLATTKRFSKISISNENKALINKKVMLSDLDIVNHVNNIKYLEWCLDYLPENKVLNQKIKSFEMNFLKELSINDSILIHENNSIESSVFSISKEGKNCFGLEINW
jgi:acyl-ACP thioesterase